MEVREKGGFAAVGVAEEEDGYCWRLVHGQVSGDDGIYFLQISSFRYLRHFCSTLACLCDFASVLQISISGWFRFADGTSGTLALTLSVSNHLSYGRFLLKFVPVFATSNSNKVRIFHYNFSTPYAQQLSLSYRHVQLRTYNYPSSL